MSTKHRRRHPERPTGPAPSATRRPRRRVAACALALLVGSFAGCPAPSRDAAPVASGSGPDLPGEGAPPGPTDGAAPTPPPGAERPLDLTGVITVARLAGLERATQADELVALAPTTGGILAVALRSGRNDVQARTWVIPSAATSPSASAAVVTPIADEAALGAPSGAYPPVFLPVADGGGVILRATDNLGASGASSSLLIRRVEATGAIDDAATPVEIDGWRLVDGWAAATVGDQICVCFTGTPAAAAERPLSIACGALSPEGRWTQAPAEVAEADGGGVAPGLSGGGTRALLTWVEPAPGADRLFGLAVSTGAGGRLAFSSRADLTGQPLGADTGFAHRSRPRAVAWNDRLAFVLAGHGEVPARAGVIGPDGVVAGGLRTVPELSSLGEAPVFAVTRAGPLFIYDSVGRHGERSVISFEEGRPVVAELSSPLGGGGAEFTRLGSFSRDLGGLVVDLPGQGALVVVVRPDRVLPR